MSDKDKLAIALNAMDKLENCMVALNNALLELKHVRVNISISDKIQEYAMEAAAQATAYRELKKLIQ